MEPFFTIPTQDAYAKALHTEDSLLMVYFPEYEDDDFKAPHTDGFYFIYDILPTGEGYELHYGDSCMMQYETLVSGELPLIFYTYQPGNFIYDL